jgi:hypothetical protein
MQSVFNSCATLELETGFDLVAEGSGVFSAVWGIGGNRGGGIGTGTGGGGGEGTTSGSR